MHSIVLHTVLLKYTNENDELKKKKNAERY